MEMSGLVVRVHRRHVPVRRAANVLALQARRHAPHRRLPHPPRGRMSDRRPGDPTAHVESRPWRYVDHHAGELQGNHADDYTWLDAICVVAVGDQVRFGVVLQEPGGAGEPVDYSV